MRVVGLAQRPGAAEVIWGLAVSVVPTKLAQRELIELPPGPEYKRSGPQTVGVGEGGIDTHRSHSARSWSKYGL